MIPFESVDVDSAIINCCSYYHTDLGDFRKSIYKHDKYAHIKDRDELQEAFLADLSRIIDEISEEEKKTNAYIAGLIHGVVLMGGKINDKSKRST